MPVLADALPQNSNFVLSQLRLATAVGNSRGEPDRRAFPNCESIRAAGQGFEPRYHPPEGCVLPLDDPAITLEFYHKMKLN